MHSNAIVLVLLILSLADGSDLESLKATLEQEIECPTWYRPVIDNGSTWCECQDKAVQNGTVLHCPQIRKVLSDSNSFVFSRDDLNVSISTNMCMTHDSVNKQTVLAVCPYNFHQPDSNFLVTLPSSVSELNDFMCANAGREGELCNLCVANKGPDISALNSKCFDISRDIKRWLVFFGWALIIPTAFFLVVLLCKLRTTTGPLNALIYFSQGVSVIASIQRQNVKAAIGVAATDWRFASGSERLMLIPKGVIVLFYGFWYNQCSGPFNFSVTTKISSLQVLALGYALALYPMFLIMLCVLVIWMHNHGCKLLTYLWRLFHRCTSHLRVRYDPISSIVHTFATFILLIYTRILDVSFSLLAPTKVYNLSGELDYKVLVYDPSIQFLSRQHMPYVILSLSMLTVFCGLPLLILCLYPMTCFQRVLNKTPILFRGVIREFGKAYTGCYRDKTDADGVERRYFASFYFVIRIIHHACLYFVDPAYYWLALILVPLLVSVLFAGFQPYRKWWLNVADSAGFTLITLITVLYAYNMFIARIPLWIPEVLLAVPFLYIVALVFTNAGFKIRDCYKQFRADRHTCDEESFTTETTLLNPLHT